MNNKITEIELTVKWGAERNKVKKLAKKLALKYNVTVVFWHNNSFYRVRTKGESRQTKEYLKRLKKG